MNKVSEYKIVTHHSLERLCTEVNKEIKNGWIPLNNPIIEDCYYQAMVKNDSNEQDSQPINDLFLEKLQISLKRVKQLCPQTDTFWSLMSIYKDSNEVSVVWENTKDQKVIQVADSFELTA